MTAPRAEFERLVLPLQDSLYFAALALTRHEADALDLVQETLLKAWRGFGSFNRGDNVKAWAFTVLRHAHVDRCRRRRLEPVRLDPEIDLQAAPSAPAFEAALPDDLLRALRSLSPAHQWLLLLCDIEGLSYREIADVLSCPIGSVMSGLYNARAQMRLRLGEERKAPRRGQGG